MKNSLFTLLISTSLAGTAIYAPAQADDVRDPETLKALEYRNIGPFRGGRATAVAGHADQPYTYYIGTTGGVWKTTDAGQNWAPISDKVFKTASVGAIAVAPSDPNVVVVGMGESPYRGVASSHGDGVYISTDGGVNFKHMGLKGARQISTVHIHPENPDVIWVAVQGSPWAATDERGVYKSTDGGKSWSKTLFVNDITGAVDLSVDMNNPRILYAAMWDTQRKPYEIRSGGEGSGLWKSTDGGETWSKMSKGLPKDTGKNGIVASPVQPGRVWSVIEAKDGKEWGVYRSDDFGESWKRVNGERKLIARSWYYMHIFADPVNADTVYVQNSAFYKSIDGGKTFSTRITGTHGDFHDFWINPDNPEVVGVANDGGGAVSFNGGKTWSTQMNQPTAQFYRVNADNGLFYNVYAGQQDNSTVSVPARAADGAITAEDFKPVGGCESAHVSFDPDNPRYIYAGCYLGQISEYDSQTGLTRDIRVYPSIDFGISPKDRKYRFNWNAPILVSSHDPNVIYHAGNHVFRTNDRGYNWDVISPDLTKNDPDTLGVGGRPITNEVSENYGTILALSEDATDANTLWSGSDDGLVQITRDGGATWTDITPKRAGDGMINSIELSPHAAGTAYITVAKYKYNDHSPNIFKTTNYGKSWKKISKGIEDGAFVRVVREDRDVKGLLYAGTELGMFVSFNDGKDWQSLQNNLPVVPVTDLKVHQGDLVLSTQGRAFWVMDNIIPLQETPAGDTHLFSVKDAYMLQRSSGSNVGKRAKNPASGATFYYTLPEAFDAKESKVTMTISDADGNVVRTLSSKAKKGDTKLAAKSGLNKANWNLKGDMVEGIKKAWSFGSGGKAKAGGSNIYPGSYTVTMAVGEWSASQSFDVAFDPRVEVSAEAWAEKKAMAAEAGSWFVGINKSINDVRSASKRIKGLMANIKDEDLKAQAKELKEALDNWENSVFSPKREFFQDVLNWEDKLATFVATHAMGIDGSVPPITQGYKDRHADVKALYDAAMASKTELMDKVTAFNAAFRDKGEDVVTMR